MYSKHKWTVNVHSHLEMPVFKDLKSRLPRNIRTSQLLRRNLRRDHIPPPLKLSPELNNRKPNSVGSGTAREHVPTAAPRRRRADRGRGGFLRPAPHRSAPRAAAGAPARRQEPPPRAPSWEQRAAASSAGAEAGKRCRHSPSRRRQASAGGGRGGRPPPRPGARLFVLRQEGALRPRRLHAGPPPHQSPGARQPPLRRDKKTPIPVSPPSPGPGGALQAAQPAATGPTHLLRRRPGSGTPRLGRARANGRTPRRPAALPAARGPATLSPARPARARPAWTPAPRGTAAGCQGRRFPSTPSGTGREDKGEELPGA